MIRLRGKTASVVNYSEVSEDDDNIEISLLPNPNNSDVEDESKDDVTENESSKLFDVQDEILSYRQVFENYTEKQADLESDHQYNYIDGGKSFDYKLKK